MKVEQALDLVVNDKVPSTKNVFQSISSWHFEYEGVEYRLCQWEGIKIFVETIRLPRTMLDQVWLSEAAKEVYGHINH